MTAPTATPLVDAADVARALGVSPWTVRRRAHAGDLPYVRAGARRMRFDPAAVAAAVTSTVPTEETA